MRRYFLAALFLAALAWAANVKLYLKDGTFHIVREYQVQTDRVHFYSVERSQWEDIPLDLVDLKRTEAEAAARKAQLDADAKSMAEEEKAEREMAKEVSRIPQDPGVYWLEGNETHVIKNAESTVHNNKGRSVLKRLSPIPMVTGKATLELQGVNSLNVFKDPEQEFYIQLSETERFGIARLTPKNGVRIVENLTIMPVTNEIVQEPEMVEILKKQLADGLYKIWPKEKLPNGEYAVVQYSEDRLDMQVWDFAIKAK
ncbi:MAG TPA: hypothetical protein VMH28_17370 [Candidatus Acidoferrales bacterium]|nr:hypothetical protein [Candidatus Acidoferrales bacterium]